MSFLLLPPSVECADVYFPGDAGRRFQVMGLQSPRDAQTKGAGTVSMTEYETLSFSFRHLSNVNDSRDCL